MANKPKKLMVIGFDAPVPQMIQDLAAKGKLPTFRKFMKDGVFALNCMAPYPTITPPNWTTIVTGAWAGTHGITCFSVHNPGDPLDVTHQGFNTADCKAEYLWQAAARAGKKAILFNYPSTWPTTIKKGMGVQVGGAALSINAWRTDEAAQFGPGSVKRGIGTHCSICDAQLFTTQEYPRATRIRPVQGEQGLEADLPFSFPASKEIVKDRPVWHLRIPRSGTVVVSKSRSGKDVVASLKVGQWSDVITEKFKTNKGTRTGRFRIKLTELSKDASTLTLFFTAICQTDGWSVPASVAKDFADNRGLPLPDSHYRAYNLGWIDEKTCMEEWDMVHSWYADAVTKLLTKYEWDIFFMHAHIMDWAGHGILTGADPIATKDKTVVKRHQQMLVESYQSCDKLLAEVMKCADDDTLVIIVSDHGAVASGPHVPIAKILADAGLLVYKPKEGDMPGPPKVDWKKTKAVQQRAAYIYVNVKGREPDGIVKPGKEYEEVRDKIIAALYDYVDPATNRKPITLALRREDARIIGLYGDRVGDIVYAVDAPYGGQHGQHLPTESHGIGSLATLFMMRGPNVKKNLLLERTMWLTDIVPTVCYLMDLPVPKNAEGAILYQALEDPDLKLTEKEEILQNYKRLKKAYDAEVALTHSYNR